MDNKTEESDSESHLWTANSKSEPSHDNSGVENNKNLKRSRTISVLTMSSVLLYSLTLTSCSTEPLPKQTSTMPAAGKQLAQKVNDPKKKKKDEDEKQNQSTSYHGGHGSHIYFHGGGGATARENLKRTAPVTTNGASKSTYVPTARPSSPAISTAHTTSVAPARGFFGWAGGFHFGGFGG